MADIILLLMRIEELEGRIGEMYEWLSGLFSDEKDISSFFAKMTQDEKQHKDLAAYQTRVVRKNRSIFPDIDVDLTIIENQLSRIKEFRSSSPTMEEAIRFALEIEQDVCEQYYKDILKSSNKEVSTLIDNLARACEDHYKDCQEIAKKHGISDNV